MLPILVEISKDVPPFDRVLRAALKMCPYQMFTTKSGANFSATEYSTVLISGPDTVTSVSFKSRIPAWRARPFLAEITESLQCVFCPSNFSVVVKKRLPVCFPLIIPPAQFPPAESSCEASFVKTRRLSRSVNQEIKQNAGC